MLRKYFAAFDCLYIKMSVDTSQNLTLRPLFKDPGVDLTAYRDQHFKGSRMQQEKLLKMSSTLYVGNLSYYTTEEQIYELFSKCGDLKRVVMGLDKFKKTPCGFCFVEYCERLCAENAVRYINGTRLDDRVVRTDWDAGFKEGRQFGRGKAGGQVRDEYRMDFDPGRGGFGARAQLKGEKQLTRAGNAIERETPKQENEET